MIQNFAFLFLSIFSITVVSAQGTSVAGDYSDFSFIDGGTPSAKTIFKTMNQDDLLKITIETDLDHLIENKYKDDYQEAKLTFISEEGLEQHT